MNTELTTSSGGYTSKAQIARVMTEAWVAREIACPGCSHGALMPAPNNTPVIDFVCRECDREYQLKSSSTPIGRRLPDAAYEPFRTRVLAGRAPHLLVLHYVRALGSPPNVEDVLLIPKEALSPSCIEPRPPLGPTARWAGWIGCNVRLDRVPDDARIWLVKAGVAADQALIETRFARMQAFGQLDAGSRGWTLDVLRAVRALGRVEFSPMDVYSFEDEMAELHPNNRYVRAKMRQQLQVLRDLGFLEFVGGGRYRVLPQGETVQEEGFR